MMEQDEQDVRANYAPPPETCKRLDLWLSSAELILSVLTFQIVSAASADTSTLSSRLGLWHSEKQSLCHSEKQSMVLHTSVAGSSITSISSGRASCCKGEITNYRTSVSRTSPPSIIFYLRFMPKGPFLGIIIT